MPSTTATRDSDGRRATALAPATGTLGSQPTTGDRRPRGVRPGVLLTIVLTAQLMAILDVNIVNVAAATIRTDLHTSGAALQLVLAGYTIAYAVLLITGARLATTLGVRRAFLAGLAAFTAASLACGLAGDTTELIAFRFVQGAGAALMIPQVFSLIQRHFTGAARARAFGHYAAVIAGGIVAGQVLGGVLVDADLLGTGWRPVFLINVPIGIVLLALGTRVLPSEAAGESRRLDLPGLVALGISVLALVVPLVFGHDQGWPLWGWLTLGGSAVMLGLFALVQRRAVAPLMPGRLFRAPALASSMVAMFLIMGSYGGYLFTVALHLQSGLGFSPLRAGLTFAPMAACFGASSLNWRRVPERWHHGMIVGALVVCGVSVAVVALSLRGGATPDVLFFAAQVTLGSGAGFAFSPLMAKALAGVRPADATDASGLVTTVVQLAQVIGLAALGAVYLSLVPSHGSSHAIVVALFADAAVMALAAGAALRLPRTPG